MSAWQLVVTLRRSIRATQSNNGTFDRRSNIASTLQVEIGFSTSPPEPAFCKQGQSGKLASGRLINQQPVFADNEARVQSPLSRNVGINWGNAMRRRDVLKLSAGAVLATPHVATAKRERTLKFVPIPDLTTMDPVGGANRAQPDRAMVPDPDRPRSSSMTTTLSAGHPRSPALFTKAYCRSVDSRLCST
jgi:hypothetical protein